MRQCAYEAGKYLSRVHIAGEELPRMLEMAKNEGSHILPVILSPCVFSHTKLSQFQAVNDPTQPLNALPEYKQEEIWARLAEIVYKALSMPPDVPVPLSPSPPLGTTLLTYKGHSDIVRAVAWSPDSRRLASGSDDKTVQVWDVTSGQCIAIYEGHSSKVNAVAWSPDGNWLASSSWADTIQVWDAVTSQPRPTYKGHAKHVNAIAWSARQHTPGFRRLYRARGGVGCDGKDIASASEDWTVQVWSASEQMSNAG